MLSSSKLNCPSEAMSTIVAEFCDYYTGEMDWATLKAVTREEVIPEIDPDVSMFLLKTCLTLHDDAEVASDYESWHVLRDRCIDACAPSWKETILVPLQSVSDKTKDLPHRQLPPPTQVALLEKALCEAGMEVAQLQEELAILNQKRYSRPCRPVGNRRPSPEPEILSDSSVDSSLPRRRRRRPRPEPEIF